MPIRGYVIPKYDPINPPPAYVGVGMRLREARHAAHLEQADLKALIGMGPTVVSQIENARRRISVFELDAFAEVYGASYRWLLHGEEVQDEDGKAIVADPAVRMLASDLMNLPEENRARIMRMIRALVNVEASAT